LGREGFGVRRQSAAATALLEKINQALESGVALRLPPQSRARPGSFTLFGDPVIVGL
jgi:hypothetical protein